MKHFSYEVAVNQLQVGKDKKLKNSVKNLLFFRFYTPISKCGVFLRQKTLYLVSSPLRIFFTFLNLLLEYVLSAIRFFAIITLYCFVHF